MELYISLISAVLAIAATAVSVWTLYETRRISQLTVNVEMLEFGNEILLENPQTLRLHGITEEHIKQCDMTVHDFLYLLNSLYAGQSFFYVKNTRKVTISAYRQNMLRQPGVKKAWNELIRGKMIAQGPYAAAIDEFYKNES